VSAFHNAYDVSDDRFATFVDQDGEPPCECNVCGLFDPQRPGETRREWLTRIVGNAANESRRTRGN
jgi:hypothetical protein